MEELQLEQIIFYEAFMQFTLLYDVLNLILEFLKFLRTIQNPSAQDNRSNVRKYASVNKNFEMLRNS